MAGERAHLPAASWAMLSNRPCSGMYMYCSSAGRKVEPCRSENWHDGGVVVAAGVSRQMQDLGLVQGHVVLTCTRRDYVFIDHTD